MTASSRYQWLIPTGRYGYAHAFALGTQLSLCVRGELGPPGDLGWEREDRLPGEPRRARCLHCKAFLERFPAMREMP